MQWHVSVAGDEDDRDLAVCLAQGRLELETTRSRQPDVEHQASGPIRRRMVEERLGRGEGLDLQTDRPNESPQRPAHGYVVVDDVHDGVGHPVVLEPAHGISAMAVRMVVYHAQTSTVLFPLAPFASPDDGWCGSSTTPTIVSLWD
jgi:hypothetical protein